MRNRVIGFYFVLTVVFVVGWNIVFGVGRVPQSTEERLYRYTSFGLYVSIGVVLVWWLFRRKLDELEESES